MQVLKMLFTEKSMSRETRKHKDEEEGFLTLQPINLLREWETQVLAPITQNEVEHIPTLRQNALITRQ